MMNRIQVRCSRHNFNDSRENRIHAVIPTHGGQPTQAWMGASPAPDFARVTLTPPQKRESRRFGAVTQSYVKYFWNSALAISLLTLISLPAAAGWEEAVGAYNKGDYATAAREFRPFAEQGQATAQYILGWIYQNGDGVEKNPTESAKWYEKAAEKGNVDAQAALGSYYMSGTGVTRDDAAAAKWFRKAAEQNKASAQYLLGYLLSRGEGVQKNEAEAIQWYRKAAEQGYGDAQYALGLALSSGGQKDEAESNKWLQKAAEGGNLEAAYLIGWNYEKGVGGTPNYAEAAKWYKKSADADNAEAQYHLATLYRDGKGVEKNDQQAMALFKKAADKGQPNIPTAIDEYLKKGQPALGFDLANVWLAKRPDDVTMLTMLGFSAANEARNDPAKYGAAARSYGDKAIALIQENKKPQGMPDAEWAEYRNKWLPQLNMRLGSMHLKAGELDLAKARFEKSTSLNAKDAYSWYLLGQTYFAEYQKMNNAAKSLEGAARSEATGKAFAKLDQVIDAYARAVGLSAGRSEQKDLHDPVLQDLTNIYDYRHGSKSGLDQLIAKYKAN